MNTIGKICLKPLIIQVIVFDGHRLPYWLILVRVSATVAEGYMEDSLENKEQDQIHSLTNLNPQLLTLTTQDHQLL